MKSEIFLLFFQLKYQDYQQDNEGQNCIQKINNIFDDFNYQMKQENVQRL
ncbi:unnamed protein product [Paramecium sonneborni]|uniref:Uncharacterized protein n=1 Tax=Paramecium sonneborni TaxID=65129 RepID=A0A8S1QXX1_9CILI|nr:unnamed protein product [Paramecium sonneborni]